MSRVRHASTHVQLLQGTDNLTHSEDEHQQVCVQLHTSAVNVTLLAFAAERRAAAPCCSASAAGRPAPAAVAQYFPPARRLEANTRSSAIAE